MPRRNLERELASVHYDIDALREVTELLTEDSEVRHFSISVDWSEASMTFETIEDLLASSKVPDAVRDFSVQVTTRKGSAHLMAGDRNRLHKIILRGDDGWVRQIDSRIQEFANFRSDSLGGLKVYLGWLQLALVGAFIYSYQEQLTAFIVTFYHISAPFSYHLRAFSILGVAILLQVPKELYPYVSLEIENDSLRYKKTASYLSVLSTVVVTLAAFFQIIGLI